MNQILVWLPLPLPQPTLLREQEGALVALEECPPSTPESPSPLLLKAKLQLEEYFQGQRQSFDLPLQPKGSAFQKRIWQQLLQCPYGQTLSYQALALAAGHPQAARAVGGAMARNPLPIFIPCHRVVKKGQTHGANYTFGGIKAQEFLLHLENPS